jgi:hypothetical protein
MRTYFDCETVTGAILKIAKVLKAGWLAAPVWPVHSVTP